MYALNLADDGRVLSATYPQYAPDDATIVDYLPDGDMYEYRYINNQFVHDPLPTPDPAPAPTPDPSQPDYANVWDELDAAYQAGYDEGYMEGVNSAYDQ